MQSSSLYGRMTGSQRLESSQITVLPNLPTCRQRVSTLVFNHRSPEARRLLRTRDAARAGKEGSRGSGTWLWHGANMDRALSPQSWVGRLITGSCLIGWEEPASAISASCSLRFSISILQRVLPLICLESHLLWFQPILSMFSS